MFSLLVPLDNWYNENIKRIEVQVNVFRINAIAKFEGYQLLEPDYSNQEYFTVRCSLDVDPTDYVQCHVTVHESLIPVPWPMALVKQFSYQADFCECPMHVFVWRLVH